MIKERGKIFMEIHYAKSESLNRPELVDDHSSKYVTYIRKNIVQKQVKDETTGESHMVYEYEEAKLTKTDYARYLIEQQRADINYIAIMADVDLEEN